MFLQISRRTVRFLAHVAHVRIFTGVRFKMRFEGDFIIVIGVAKFANHRAGLRRFAAIAAGAAIQHVMMTAQNVTL